MVLVHESECKENRRNFSKLIGNAILPIVFCILCIFSFWGYKGKLTEFDTKFKLRKFSYKLAMNFRFQFLKDNFFNDTYTRDHKWLMYIDDLSLGDHQNTIPLTPDELQRIQTNLDNVESTLAKMGIKFYIIMPPNKNTIYPEYLTPEIPIIGEESRLSQLMEFQRENGSVKVIDIRDRLNEVRQLETIYYETDTHWNPRGAYEGYRALIDVIREDFPTVTPIGLEECDIRPDQRIQGGLSEISGWINAYSYFDDLIPNDRVNNVVRKENIDGVRYVFFENDSVALPSAIIYRDSFFTAMQPYLAQNFRELIDVWTYKVDLNFIKQEKPDIVIFLMTERIIQRLKWFPN